MIYSPIHYFHRVFSLFGIIVSLPGRAWPGFLIWSLPLGSPRHRGEWRGGVCEGGGVLCGGVMIDRGGGVMNVVVV